MNQEERIEWFKETILPSLSNYEVSFKFFEQGDFGSLYQIEFNSDKIGGNVDFWGLGWLGVFVWDYVDEKEILNILLESNQEDEKEKVFIELNRLIGV